MGFPGCGAERFDRSPSTPTFRKPVEERETAVFTTPSPSAHRHTTPSWSSSPLTSQATVGKAGRTPARRTRPALLNQTVGHESSEVGEDLGGTFMPIPSLLSKISLSSDTMDTNKERLVEAFKMRRALKSLGFRGKATSPIPASTSEPYPQRAKSLTMAGGPERSITATTMGTASEEQDGNNLEIQEPEILAYGGAGSHREARKDTAAPDTDLDEGENTGNISPISPDGMQRDVIPLQEQETHPLSSDWFSHRIRECPLSTYEKDGLSTLCDLAQQKEDVRIELERPDGTVLRFSKVKAD